ncbi:protein odr-4 homolog [Microplitis demolitor]|uniref:protein odr-4 homolog n=1 Tax=Microplitis demolitor TaxID=69319 RepID=UPI0004CCA973|nr:protein odr-4 homolog [Microplitis demolitor]
MGRIVYAEECLLNYLESLAQSDAYTVGLILGQSTEDTDYVIHLARTPPPASKDVIEETLIGSTTNLHQESPVQFIKSIKDVPSSWVADHAKHVTRMLPGGMWVLGIFIVGPDDCLNNSDSTQRLRSIITTIHQNLESDPYLYGNNPHDNIILAYNSRTKRFSCKSFGANGSGSLKNAEVKFQSKITKWYQLDTHVDFDQMYPVIKDHESDSLKKQFQNILEDISNKIGSSIVVLEGESMSLDDPVEILGEKKKKDRKESKSNDTNFNNRVLEAVIYIPSLPNKSTSLEIKRTNFCASIRLQGQLISRTFVHQSSTIGEAASAIKHDIMRSMTSRLEMHADSLIEEENGLPEDNITLHEPPRRVLVALPKSRITLSDYLFPGEGPQEALISLQELLDLEVQESNVQKDFELQADPSEFYSQNEIISEPTEQKKYSDNNHLFLYISGLIVALIILIISILIHYFY